jgi:hypothetical protein
MPKSSWVISHVNVELKISISETSSVPFIDDIDSGDGDGGALKRWILTHH